MKKFRDFESARVFARKLGLKNHKKWTEYCKSGEKPDDIPHTAQVVYKSKGWKSWGDWLGTGVVATKNKQYLPFAKARKFVRSLNLKSQNEWNAYCKSGDKPDDIPQDVRSQYKNKGWNGYGDFLGTGRMATRTTIYSSFNESRKFVHTLHLSGQNKWIEYCKSGNKPNNIPAAPWTVYKNKGWISMGDFFGTNRIANYDLQFRPYKESREFVIGLGLKNKNEYSMYCKSGNKPDDIPASPHKTYKNKGWTGWGTYLGTGNVRFGNIEYRPYKEAKKFVRSLGLQNASEWKEYCKSGNKPKDIPSAPWVVYKEWKKK
jgi:hypothetical protein